MQAADGHVTVLRGEQGKHAHGPWRRNRCIDKTEMKRGKHALAVA